MRLVKFGTILLPEADGEHSVPIGARSSLVSLQNGAFDQDGNAVYLESQRISYRVLFTSDLTNIDSDIQRLLGEAVKGRNVMQALWRDNLTTVGTFAKVKNVQRVAKADKYQEIQPIAVNWEQDYPYWVNMADGWFLDTGHFLDDGDVLDGHYEERSITASPHTFTIDNSESSVEVADGTITIIPNAASNITNINIYNDTNGFSLHWTGTLNASERLVIDFLTKTIERDGETEFANFSLGATRQIRWMQLDTGINNIRVTCTSITGTVKLYWQWKRHYL